jgi:uncharacterized membrane protein YqjE
VAEHGLIASLRAFLRTLVALGHTRLALFSAEFEEAIERLAEIVLWSAVALIAAVLALLLLALTVVIAFWEQHRLLAASAVTALGMLVALAALLRVRHLVRERPRLFADSLEELRQDVDALGDEP